MPSVDSQATSRALVAANLDRAIRERGWTNRQLGERIGSTEHQVWRWRHAKHMPSIESLVALAEVLFEGDLSALFVDAERDAA